MIKAQEYQERRNKLLKNLPEGSLLLLFGGSLKTASADQSYDFVVNRNFYYLTGIDQEDSILALVKAYDEIIELLFIDEKDEHKEKWTGLKLSIEDARLISGIQNVLLNNSFEGKLEAILDSVNGIYGSIKEVYLDLEMEQKYLNKYNAKEYASELLKKYNSISVYDIYKLIAKQRMIKSKAEVAMIKDAIATTELGLNNVLRIMEPGKFEYNLRNMFEYIVHEDMQAGLAFPTIVASGKNGVILHYPNATDMLESDQLVLMDCGASKGYYCADISRTYPISHKFTELERKIYQIVLDCNKETMNFMRPGVTLQEVKDFARNFLATECVEKGLIATKEEISRVYYHGCSHHLGLDTHDVSDTLDKPLEPGNIITCEPGLYFKEFGIGVRIEDDVLITETGHDNLSKNIIKEIADIENFLK